MNRPPRSLASSVAGRAGVCATLAAASMLAASCASGSSGGERDIRQPPGGSLSPEQLAAIAADIRTLEAAPFAPGAAEGRRTLMRWVLVSPDVRMTMCVDLVQPLTDGDHPHTDAMLLQFTLSAAAHKIEDPSADQAAMNVAGMEGALAVYEAAGAADPEAPEHAFMEELVERRKDGGLGEAVREASSGC